MAYKVPFVNYPLHYHLMEAEINAALKEVFNGGDYIMRRQMRQFEEEIAAYVGTKYAIGLNSGTDALYFSVLGAGLGAGDEVITVAHTFVATVAAIVQCGATPVLVDVGKDYNMDVNKLEQAITPRTKAIIPVHLNGRLCDMTKLMDIAKKHKLIVIEDAAQALGATFGGQKGGSFGITGCFSFYPAKILGCFGDGGMLVTNDKAVADKSILLRDNGQVRSTGDILLYGYNSRLDNLQAAILSVKLKYLPGWIKRRRELAALYNTGLSPIEQVTPPPPHQSGEYFDVYTNYVIRARRRDELAAHLVKSGVEVLISWPKPMHHHKALGLEKYHLPETESISREVLSLPMYPELTEEQVEYATEAVKKFYVK
jgi:dTDP-4-amino-4,6-dideoxygalactose transaminase